MDTPAERLERWFPNLKADGYEITSPEDPHYNCIAWILGLTDAWWEPSTNPKHSWPEAAPSDDRISSVVAALRTARFEECAATALEVGQEKVAIYGDDETYFHGARQLPDGRWTSKIGVFEDIIHNTLHALIGEEYGRVVKVLRRAKAAPAPPS